MATPILFREELKEYDFGPGHPFRGDRYEKLPQVLKSHLPAAEYPFLQAEPATENDLLLICRQDYIDFTREFFKAANQGLRYPDGPDIFSFFHSQDNRPFGRPGKMEEAARLIVGQAKMAGRLVMAGTYRKVISIGGGLHHAKPEYGEGFCLYNDVAFCALNLLREYKLERVLILDTDAHAGNGTSEYFYEDPRVLFIDLHQDPATIYPGTGFANQTGEGKGKGFTVNIPLPPGAGDDSYRLVFESIVEPLAAEFRPQIIIRNGGSDPHFADDLTDLGLTMTGFRLIGEKVREMAGICDDREIDLIASGYNKAVLPPAWLALIAGLTGNNIQPGEPIPVPERFFNDRVLDKTKQVIAEVKNNLKDYWACLR